MGTRTRLSFFIDPELAAGLKLLKAETGISESEAIRRAIAGYLLRAGIQAPTKAASRRAGTRRKA